MELDICEQHEWAEPNQPPVHLFVDARGSPPRCAAVLIVDGECWYTDGVPSRAVMRRFLEREDNQIMGLEMVAIALGATPPPHLAKHRGRHARASISWAGLLTFAAKLHKRKVIVYSDNTGAEARPYYVCDLWGGRPAAPWHGQAATRKGTAKCWDHCQIAHEVWTQALLNKFHLWIVRVPSDDNVADPPSREDYALMKELGAQWCKPLVVNLFVHAPSGAQ